MITSDNALEQRIIDQLMACDLVVQEYHLLQRAENTKLRYVATKLSDV